MQTHLLVSAVGAVSLAAAMLAYNAYACTDGTVPGDSEEQLWNVIKGGACPLEIVKVGRPCVRHSRQFMERSPIR